MVVLPLVPVIPTTVSSEVGSSLKAAAIGAIAALASSTCSLRRIELERALHDQGRGAGLDRRGREVVSVGLLAGEAEEERALGHPAAVIGEIANLHGRVAAHVGGDASSSQQLAKLHPDAILGATPRNRRSGGKR